MQPYQQAWVCGCCRLHPVSGRHCATSWSILTRARQAAQDNTKKHRRHKQLPHQPPAAGFHVPCTLLRTPTTLALWPQNDSVHCPSPCRRVTVSRIKGDTSNFHTNCQLLASVYSAPCCRPQLLREHRMGHPVATPSLILLQSSPCWCRLHTTVRAALPLCGHTHH
jgi:hypothetical protein